MNKYVILIPCFNDWNCLSLLIPKIDIALKSINEDVNIIIVNDSSTKENNLIIKKLFKINEIKVLNLKENVKAQIAIATGLSYLKEKSYEGGVIVMDADGQDDPENLVNIINESKKDLDTTIVVMRTQREESLIFKIMYETYLILTLILTFRYMKFGVFSYISHKSLIKILSTKDVYKAYAASLAKHFKEKKKIYAPRKKRITGESQNNYITLMHYALKIISVFKEQVLLNSTALILVALAFYTFKIIPVYSIIFSIILILFNILIFTISSKINNSKKIIDTLINIKDSKVLKS